MNWLDVIIIFVIFLSTCLSFFRGLLREVLSVVSWFLAIFLASLLHPSLAMLLRGVVSSPGVRAPLAYAILFVLTFMLCHFLGLFLRSFVTQAGLTHLDRMLGSVFGLLRGVMLVVLMVGLLRWFNLFVNEPWWQRAMLIPYLEHMQDVADAFTQTIGLGLAN
ncbi:MAG: CvpA family protein [Gammaproteobacteria bacterium]